jgi:hypothetical protein
MVSNVCIQRNCKWKICNELKGILASKKEGSSYKNFVIQNKDGLSIAKAMLIYYNNNILLDSLKTCFFFN